MFVCETRKTGELGSEVKRFSFYGTHPGKRTRECIAKFIRGREGEQPNCGQPLRTIQSQAGFIARGWWKRTLSMSFQRISDGFIRAIKLERPASRPQKCTWLRVPQRKSEERSQWGVLEDEHTTRGWLRCVRGQYLLVAQVVNTIAVCCGRKSACSVLACTVVVGVGLQSVGKGRFLRLHQPCSALTSASCTCADMQPGSCAVHAHGLWLRASRFCSLRPCRMIASLRKIGSDAGGNVRW